MNRLSLLRLAAVAAFYALLTVTDATAAMDTDGLVAWYPFNGNANDQSGNGNDATVSNAVLASDRFGNANSAYQFNGNEYIQTPLKVQSSQGTLAAWVYVDGYETGYNKLNLALGQWDNLQLGLGDSTMGADGKWVFRHRDSDGLQNAIGPTAVTNQWIHVAGVWSGNDIKLYLDGILQDQVSTGSLTAALGDMVIGRHSDTYSQNYWFGRIDDVAIYNRALSAAEVAQLAAVPLPPAVWLFGSALLGLLGFARRKQA